jgi:hypothetical protein
MTRLGEYPRRIVTAAERVGVRFYFDPKLIDIRQVKGYGLWSQEGDSRVWKKIGAASPDSQPLAIEPARGSTRCEHPSLARRRREAGAGSE